jgi:hypothetical protein
MSLRRFLAVPVILALVSACSETVQEPSHREVSAVAAVNGGSGPLVTGSGHFVDVRLAEPGFRNFAFTAHSDNGQWQLDNRAFPTRIHGSVECLTVVANEAWFAGPTTQSSDPTQIGVVRGFRVVDNGQGHGSPPDQITFAHAPESAQAWCDATPPRPLVDIEKGNIQVH